MPTENAGKLRIVLDTNVYISAFTHPQGPPFRLWKQARSGTFRLLVSPAIVRETAGVLRNTFAWAEDRIIRRAKLLVRLGEVVSPAITLAVFTGADEPDNRILECAVTGEADVIVSGDHGLQRLKVYHSIPIIRPIDALRTLGGLPSRD